MNHQHSIQTLAFERVEYPVRQVRQWLGYTDLDCFVFDFYFPVTKNPARPITLCCFACNTLPGYYNAYDPDLLAPYPGGLLELSGPLKLTGNLVTAANMRAFLASIDPADNFLQFSPLLDEHRQVRYSIRAFRRTPAGDIFDGGTINTNASPPATAIQPVTEMAAMPVL